MEGMFVRLENHYVKNVELLIIANISKVNQLIDKHLNKFIAPLL